MIKKIIKWFFYRTSCDKKCCKASKKKTEKVNEMPYNGEFIGE